MYKFSVNAKVLINNDKVILGDPVSGRWIRISKKEYDILNCVIKENIVREEYKQKIKVLTDIGIIVQADKEEITELKSIMIAITNTCNLKCVHCGFSAGPENKEQLSYDEIVDLIKANKDIDSITITGGEPLIHPDFLKIANYLGDNFPGEKVLMTNATMINERNIEIVIKNFDSISISIDAATEETCNYMRGKDVFNHIITIVKELKKKGITDISLSFVLTDFNRHEEEDFKKMCKNLDVKPMVREFFVVGRGKENETELAIKDNLKKTNEITVIDVKECQKNIRIHGKCGAGRSSLYVQYDGTIYPCPVAAIYSDFAMENIKNIVDRNLQQVIENRRKYKGFCKFDDISCDNFEYCSNCDVKDFCWACIQEYYSFFTCDETRKNFCDAQKDMLRKIIWGD